MIAIVNQHRGSFDELINHIENYISNVDPNCFHMYLVIDQPYNDDQTSEIKRFQDQHLDKMTVIPHPYNKGLTPSRLTALRAVESDGIDKYSQVILGCTNCEYIRPLDINLATDLESYKNQILIVPCRYNKEGSYTEYEEYPAWSGVSKVSFGQYLSDYSKPDFTLVFPTVPLIRTIVDYKDRYTPEEIWMYNVLIYLNRNDEYINPSTLAVWQFNYPFQHAWYNPNGLTKSFDRKFVLENKRSFQARAEILLKAYDLDYISLSRYMLKTYLADYITLSDKFDLSIFSERLKVMARYEFQHWVEDADIQHYYKFIE